MGKVVHVSTARRSLWCEGMKIEVSANVVGWKHRFADIIVLRNKTARIRSYHRGEEIEIRLTDILREVAGRDEPDPIAGALAVRQRERDLRHMRFAALNRGV